MRHGQTWRSGAGIVLDWLNSEEHGGEVCLLLAERAKAARYDRAFTPHAMRFAVRARLAPRNFIFDGGPMTLNHGIRMLCLITSFGVTALGATACVSTGSVEASAPLAAPITSGRVVIQVVADRGGDKEHAAELEAAFNAAFSEANFSVGEAGGLTIKASIDSFDTGNKAQRAMNLGGEAVVEVLVEVHRGGAVISKFLVIGNSARTSTTTIGGYNTSWGDSLPSRALLAAAEKTVEYLADPSS